MKKEKKMKKCETKEKLYAEMLNIMMIEDGLNLDQAQETLANFFRIDIKDLRSLLYSNPETREFAYDNLLYDKEKRKYIKRWTLNTILNNVREKFEYLR
jgi:hypothetical protein